MSSSLFIIFLKSIITPIIGIYIASKFNIFEYVSFIPEDQTFSFGIAAYIALLECIYVKLNQFIVKHLKAEIECLFYVDKHVANIVNMPITSFIQDVAYINCKVTIKGVTKKLKKNSLVISMPKWVEIQSANNLTGYTNNEKNQFILSFDRIISGMGKVVDEATVDIKIGIIRNSAKEELSSIITPYLSKKFLYNFTFNKFQITNKRG